MMDETSSITTAARRFKCAFHQAGRATSHEHGVNCLDSASRAVTVTWDWSITSGKHAKNRAFPDRPALAAGLPQRTPVA
jgi:hypothetical protein